MHDKKAADKTQSRLEKLSEVALKAYIKAHCGALVLESEETVGKVLTNFAKAMHKGETNDLSALADQFSTKKLTIDFAQPV